MAIPHAEHTNGTHMHRRKSSKEEGENVLIFPLDEPTAPTMQPPPPVTNGKRVASSFNGGENVTKLGPNASSTEGEGKKVSNGRNGWAGHNRVASYSAASSVNHASLPTSHSHPPHPPSAGPYHTSFPGQPSPPANGLFPYAPNGRHQPPAMRQSLSLPASSSHIRTRSVSGPFTPITPSPLSTSFAASQTAPNISVRAVSHSLIIPTSPTAPELSPSRSSPRARFPISNSIPPSPVTTQGAHARRHARVHSRNLSVYFPRPGSIPATSIDEDGAQEIEFPPSLSYSSNVSSDEGVLIPNASPAPGQVSFREGFTFGARPSNGLPLPLASSQSAGALRRGHHHKHSLSHNFFSFLEPGRDLAELHTSPTPIPASPWNPISPWPGEKDQARFGAVSPIESNGPMNGLLMQEKPVGRLHVRMGVDSAAACVAAGQFVLGATLWVVGQQIGSLACTGLGYWVVFDSFGVALGRVLPGYLAESELRGGSRRPYGNSRVETLMTYAQSVYLLFASVYVCKETVEHLLLASGEGHHHHHGDEVADIFGIDFPPLLLCITFLTLIITSMKYNNQAKLVSAAGNYIPPLQVLLPIRTSYNISRYTYPPIIENLLSNPYTLTPTLFCAALIGGFYMLHPYQHRAFDLLLAGIETVVTFSLAYPAAVALGTVLLQTAPQRGLPGGRMEAFLRAMREIERHPQVLHLPAPHIWQLAPSLARPRHSRSLPTWEGPTQSLIVTLELHVAKDLIDDDVLKLTSWAWERCRTALRYGSGDGGGEGEAEITVGIVRG